MTGLLLDENLPHRLTFDPGLPVVHATSLGPSPTDTDLWHHARQHRLVIVSKDADFSDRIMLHDAPPWVVHLRLGNLRAAPFAALLQRLWPRVRPLLPRHKLISLYSDRIEAVLDTGQTADSGPPMNPPRFRV